jgi:ABC-type polysaccharide/polyol phosphate transport system ATPase subunit
MTFAIAAHGLSKRYRLGSCAPYGALRDSIVRAAGAPARAVRRLCGGAPMSADAGWIQALADVSFEVAPGEVVGVVGRNGSGKSTLLKILARITDPTAGYADVRGQVGSLLEVGTGFHPELTGRENIFVNGAILGMSRAEIRRNFDAIVAFADVSRFLDTPVKHYSSGMQMRLAFSVAAHLRPHILLIDEVLAVGDLAFQRKCMGKMDDVSRDGRTVVFVSHQLNQLRRLCSRCLWLEHGRLRAVGPTDDVTNRYEASFMAAVADRPGHSAGAQFLSWTLGEPGTAQHEVTDFGPVTARFSVRIDRPIRNGHHGILLYDRDSRVLWGTGTDNLALEAGLYEIVYDLEGLALRPGPYRWHVSLYDEGHFIDDLECVPEMSVRTPPLGHRRDEYAGVLNFRYTMEVAELAARVTASGGLDADRRVAFRRQP